MKLPLNNFIHCLNPRLGTRDSRLQKGVTLIELAVILIILSLLGLAVASAFRDDEITFRSNIHAMKTHIRYAQSLALKLNRTWGISCDGSDYWLYEGNNTIIRNIPNESGKISLSDKKISVGNFDVSFDGYGRPDAAHSINVQSTEISDSATITVTAETGFVP